MSLVTKRTAKKATAEETKALTEHEAIQGLEQQKNHLEASIAKQQRKLEMLGQEILAKTKEQQMLQRTVDDDTNKLIALTGQIIERKGLLTTSAQSHAQTGATQAATAEMNKVDLNKVEDTMERRPDLNDRMTGQFESDMMDDDDALAELEELNYLELQYQLGQQEPHLNNTAPVQHHAPPQAQAKRSEIAELARKF
ncbi:hypothetical protein BLNAU_17684 [Blattamonas nauphoetae]|uniref:Uncharacterized protein n=1 Tax=Blattamonas nauphoetae TaxID=2049346 RepID=A0ABQ9X907_9EUKA|nr:hypothetical protein BLNAU_17684 [Blattamonas nauphoetae]